MHKKLNSVKGGDKAMKEEWKTYRTAPVLLANKDNAAILELADAEEEEIVNTGERHKETAAER